MIDFKLFEATSDDNENINKPVYVREPQGMLRKSAAVKQWEKIGVGRYDGSFGVYAIDDIQDNETFEECNVIEVPVDEVKGSVLMDYMFKISSDLYVLALGCGSMYNHKNQPNARWEYDADKQLLKLSAIRRIQMGEQIFISFGRDYFKSRNQNMKA
jgi:hypothetical protein